MDLDLWDYFGALFQNNPKELDPSFKMDTDFWDNFGRENPSFVIQEIKCVLHFHSPDLIKPSGVNTINSAVLIALNDHLRCWFIVLPSVFAD